MSIHAALPDDELVRLAANGDRGAFAVLYHRHVAAVHRQLASAAADAPAVTGLIVQVFTDAMIHLDELSARASEDVGPTLVAIAKRRGAGRRSGGRVSALTVGIVDRAWRDLDRRWPDGIPPSDPPTWWPSIAAGATVGVLVLAVLFALTPEPTLDGGPSIELAAEPLVEASDDSQGVVLPKPRETVDLSTISPTPRPIEPSPAPLESDTEEDTEPSPEPTPTPSASEPTPEPTPEPTEDVDEAPVVAIDSPSEGSTRVTEGEDEGGAYATVTLSSTATDDRDAPDLLTYSWTSDLDGALLSGPSGTARLHVPDGQLTVTHTITLTVTDSAGNVGSDSVRVIVTRAP